MIGRQKDIKRSYSAAFVDQGDEHETDRDRQSDRCDPLRRRGEPGELPGQLQGVFGNQQILEALRGGGGAVGQAIASALTHEAAGLRHAGGGQLSSNAAMIALMGADRAAREGASAPELFGPWRESAVGGGVVGADPGAEVAAADTVPAVEIAAAGAAHAAGPQGAVAGPVSSAEPLGIAPAAEPQAAATSTATIAREADGSAPLVDPALFQALLARSSGRPLPEAVARHVSQRLGVDISGARIHTDQAAAEASQSIGARAFASGGHVYFSQGEHRPGTPDGDRLLAHELVHVAQHLRGELSGGTGLTVSTPSDVTELEAEAQAREIGPQLSAPEGSVRPQLVTEEAAIQATDVSLASRTEDEQAEEGEGADVFASALEQAVEQAVEEQEDEETIAKRKREGALAAGAGAADERASEPEGEPGEVASAGLEPAIPGAATPPAIPAEPAEPAEITGAAPLDVTSWYQGQTPSQMAASAASLDQPLQSSSELVQASVVDSTPDLAATQQGVDSLPGTPQVAAPSPQASTVELDSTPAKVEVEAAPAAQGAEPVHLSSTFSEHSGEDGEASAQALGQAMGALGQAQPSVDTALTTPEIPLEGQADPAQLDTIAEAATSEGGQALAAAQEAVGAVPVESLAQPLALEETVELPAAPAVEPLPAAPSIDGMLQLEGYELCATDQAAFDAQRGDELRSCLDQASAQVAEAQAELDAEHAALLEDAAAQQSGLNSEAQAQQSETVAQAQADKAAAQDDVCAQQQAELDDALGELDAQRQASLSEIGSRVASDSAAIDGVYADASAQAEAAVAEGEEQAGQAQVEGQVEAGDDAWWDWALDAWQEAVQAVADAVSAIWEQVAALVSQILDAAVALATSMIEALVSFVADALSAYYDLYRALIRNLLGDIFPGLADLLCELIDAIQGAALSALEAIGQALIGALESLAELVVAAMDGLLQAFQAGVALYLATIEAIQQGQWADLGEVLLRALLTAAGIDPDEFLGMFGDIGEIIDEVVANPGAIAENAAAALGLGFAQFGGSFLDHFIGGAVEWMTGAADIELPDSLDIAGIFDVACQVLLLTYEHLREKAIEHVGEGAVAAVEELYEAIMAFVEGGWAGLWEHVKGELTTLVDDVVVAIGSWLVEKAILVAGRWVAGLAATMGLSSILEALKAAWQLMMWCIDQFAAIYEIVRSTVVSVHEFVFGNIQLAADRIESTLADFVAPAIDLVAKLLNISNIADKLEEVIEATGEMIDRAIDKVLETLMSTLGLGGAAGEGDGEYDGELGEKLKFSAGGESHEQWIEGETPMVASTPMPVSERLDDWRKRLNDEPSEAEGQGGPTDGEAAGKGLDTADAALAALAKEVGEAAEVLGGGGEEDAAGKAQADDEVESAQRKLVSAVGALFELYLDEVVGADFDAQLAQVHSAAQADVAAAWASVQAGGAAAPASWDEAKAAIAATAPVSAFYPKPSNKGSGFGDAAGHPQAAEAVKRAVAEVEEKGETEVPEKAKTDPDGYASDQKANTLHLGSPLAALQAEIWVGTSTMEEAAIETMEDALAELMLLGGGLPELSDEARAAIWAAVQAVGIEMDCSTPGKAYVRLADEEAVDQALSAAIAEYGSDELKAAQARWAALLLQDEHHHAWPQWLGGDVDQTLLYLPRVLHNFKVADDGSSGGFHQVFNELFRLERWEDPEGEVHEVAVNDAGGWGEFEKAFLGDDDAWSKQLGRLAELMRRAYDVVLGEEESDAKSLYLDEVDKELSELKSEGVGGAG